MRKAKEYVVLMSILFVLKIFHIGTPDFLTGITNPNERKVLPGFENTVPKSAAEMERRYKNSRIYDDMMREMVDYEAYIEKEVCRPVLI